MSLAARRESFGFGPTSYDLIRKSMFFASMTINKGCLFKSEKHLVRLILWMIFISSSSKLEYSRDWSALNFREK